MVIAICTAFWRQQVTNVLGRETWVDRSAGFGVEGGCSWAEGHRQDLCYSTRKRVLCKSFAGRNTQPCGCRYNLVKETTMLSPKKKKIMIPFTRAIFCFFLNHQKWGKEKREGIMVPIHRHFGNLASKFLRTSATSSTEIDVSFSTRVDEPE